MITSLSLPECSIFDVFVVIENKPDGDNIHLLWSDNNNYYIVFINLTRLVSLRSKIPVALTTDLFYIIIIIIWDFPDVSEIWTLTMQCHIGNCRGKRRQIYSTAISKEENIFLFILNAIYWSQYVVILCQYCIIISLYSVIFPNLRKCKRFYFEMLIPFTPLVSSSSTPSAC